LGVLLVQGLYHGLLLLLIWMCCCCADVAVIPAVQANAVPIGTFIDNMEDQELLDLLPQLLRVEAVDDVRCYLGGPSLVKQQQNGYSCR
jgi:hypothetical protein